MPIYRPQQVRPEQYIDIINKLAGELSSNIDAHGGPTGDQPYIIEEENLRGGLHVTVIWDAFANVPTAERGKVILEAINKSSGDERMMKVTLAMGLTLADAKKVGLLEHLPNA